MTTCNEEAFNLLYLQEQYLQQAVKKTNKGWCLGGIWAAAGVTFQSSFVDL